MKTYGTAATATVLRFLKVQLMQQIWCLLLDDAFMNAYTHGIVITCGDKVKRRVFPRFFTYAADYPEKYVLFTSEQTKSNRCPQSPSSVHQVSIPAPLSPVSDPEAANS